MRAERTDLNSLLTSCLCRRYAFNIVFNIINKSTLNIFPKPWLLSTIQLGKFSILLARFLSFSPSLF